MNCKQIKKTFSIRAVLESFGLSPAKENRRTAFYFALDREEKIPSFCVDFIKNCAFDFGTGRNYDVISIVQLIKKCSVSESLIYLSTLGTHAYPERLSEEIISENQHRILKINEIRHPALIQYLELRKVADQKKRLWEVHYELEGRKYFGIGFKNDSDGFEIRNRYAKVCLGAKDITLIQIGKDRTSEIAVFEGFFDYLTFMNLESQSEPACDCLVLNSTAMLFKAEKLLMKYQKILLFLDNDKNGKSVAVKIKNEYHDVEDCSLMYHNFKDLNEWFMAEGSLKK
ncbi:toprim domain-containing protein [Chryseobacterium sp.]|uniref:toprim domain-containing protein n=1 Tax=Chryseobacterium sp. TaxID=1871047 RepID=UPI0028A03F7F|nr:toprim domain-containing protein [Chryseobacterium sp.]